MANCGAGASSTEFEGVVGANIEEVFRHCPKDGRTREAGAAARLVFDVIHRHLAYFGYPLLRRLATPSVTTVLGRLDLPELSPLYKLYDDIPVVSIFNSHV